MATIEESREIGYKPPSKAPIGDCNCINFHDKAVMIVAIDVMLSYREKQIEEFKRRKGEPIGEYRIRIPPMGFKSVYENEVLNLNETRKKLTALPNCPSTE